MLALSACGNNDNRDDDYREPDCVPPYACGPMYVNYVPVFYQMHPYHLYFSPYQSSYNYSYSNGRRVVTSSNGKPRVARDSRIKWVSPKSNTPAKQNAPANTNKSTTVKPPVKSSTTTKTAPRTSTSGKR